MKRFSKKLNANIFDDDTQFVSLGRLDQHMIDFICEKNCKIGSLLSANKDILFWKDRIQHTVNHKSDFASDILFEKCFEDIPSIVSCPDYISISKKDTSISFIKDYSQHVSVAIRVSLKGGLAYRTMYPLLDAQLDNYLEKGTAWKYPNQDKNIE